jgi:hypothetical protein
MREFDSMNPQSAVRRGTLWHASYPTRVFKRLGECARPRAPFAAPSRRIRVNPHVPIFLQKLPVESYCHQQ